MPRTKVGFSKHESSSQLNGILILQSPDEMLEGKNYKYWELYFHFFGYATLGWPSVWSPFDQYSRPIHYHSQPFTVQKVLYGSGHSTQNVDSMTSYVKKFKTSVWWFLEPNFQHRLNKLQFHLLGHTFHDLDLFGTFFQPGATLYDHFNFIARASYACNLKSLKSRSGDSVQIFVSSLISQHFSSIAQQ